MEISHSSSREGSPGHKWPAWTLSKDWCLGFMLRIKYTIIVAELHNGTLANAWVSIKPQTSFCSHVPAALSEIPGIVLLPESEEPSEKLKRTGAASQLSLLFLKKNKSSYLKKKKNQEKNNLSSETVSHGCGNCGLFHNFNHIVVLFCKRT